MDMTQKGIPPSFLCFFLEFFFHLLFFFSQIRPESFAFEYGYIEHSYSEDPHENVGDIGENNFVVGNKCDSEDDNSCRPEDGSDDVIEPKFPRMHPHGSGDKRDKCPCETVKFPEYYKPGSVFFNLFAEIFKFGPSESEPISVFEEEVLSVPFAEEIPERIPDHRSDDGDPDHPSELDIALFPEKSSDEEHDILSWDEHANGRKRLDNTACKSNPVVPITQYLNLCFHPTDENLNPFRFEYHNPG